MLGSLLSSLFSFFDSLFDLGDNPLVPVNSKVQNEIQAQSKHLTAKMPSNFLDKLQEMLKPSDSAIKGSGLIVGMSAVLIAATAVTNPIAASMLLCAGMSVSLQVITDCIEGNKTSISSLVTSAAVGAVSGAAAGAVAVATEAAITKIGYDVASHFAVATVSGISGAAYDVTTQLVTTGKVDAKEVILSTALAFGTGYALSKGSEVVANKLNSKAAIAEKAENTRLFLQDETGEISLFPNKDKVINSVANDESRITPQQLNGEGTTPINTGKSRPNSSSTPNSIYEQINNDGMVKSRAFYDERGNMFARQDFDHSHFIKSINRYCKPHEHNIGYNNQGLVNKRYVIDLPSGYTNSLSK